MRRYVVVGMISGKKIKTRGGGVVMQYRPKNPPKTRKPAITPAHRWALTADGAFVLLGTDTELSRPAARALIDFVRTLDRGEVAA